MFSPRTLLILLLMASPAVAHSELRGSAPQDGATLAAAPSEVILRFNEPVQVTSMRLLNAAGETIPLRRDGDPAPSREERAALTTPAPAGALRLEWRAISADGHPIGGTLRFTVHAP